MLRAALFLGCGLMAFRSVGLEYSAFRIHTDAAALGFAAMAAGLLWRGDLKRSWSDLTLSAVFAVLSVWSKQTLAPLIVALPAFVWMCEGFRQLCKYVACLAAAGVTISLLVLAAFWPPQALWFNIFVVPASQPRVEYDGLMRSLAMLRADILLPATVVVFLALQAIFFEGRPKTGLRQFLAGQRWLVFVFVAAAMIPTFMAGELKVGGDLNHLSLVSYFVLLSAAAGLAACLSKDATDARAEAAANAARIFTVVFILAGMSRAPHTLFGAVGMPPLWSNPSQTAYNYEGAPRRGLLPLQPTRGSTGERQALPQRYRPDG